MSSSKPIDTPMSTSKVNMLSNFVCFLILYDFIKLLVLFSISLLQNQISIFCEQGKFIHAPTDAHWVAVKCIFLYLKGMISCGLYITWGSSFSLYGFTNANWGSSVDDYKSMNAYLMYFNNTPISWKSGKQ